MRFRMPNTVTMASASAATSTMGIGRAKGSNDAVAHWRLPRGSFTELTRRAQANGHHRVDVELDQPLVAQRLGHFARDDPLCKSSTMAVLPTPGSPISTGLFFSGGPALRSSSQSRGRGR